MRFMVFIDRFAMVQEHVGYRWVLLGKVMVAPAGAGIAAAAKNVAHLVPKQPRRHEMTRCHQTPPFRPRCTTAAGAAVRGDHLQAKRSTGRPARHPLVAIG